MKTNIKAGLLVISLLCGSQNLLANENRGYINIINKGHLDNKNSPNKINQIKQMLINLKTEIKNLGEETKILIEQQSALSQAIKEYEIYAKKFEELSNLCEEFKTDNIVLLANASEDIKKILTKDIDECIKNANFALDIDDDIRALSEQVLWRMKDIRDKITLNRNNTKAKSKLINYLDSSISYLEKATKAIK